MILAAVVRTESGQGEREPAGYLGDGLQQPFRGVAAGRRVLCPAGGHVCHRQRADGFCVGTRRCPNLPRRSKASGKSGPQVEDVGSDCSPASGCVH